MHNINFFWRNRKLLPLEAGMLHDFRKLTLGNSNIEKLCDFADVSLQILLQVTEMKQQHILVMPVLPPS